MKYISLEKSSFVVRRLRLIARIEDLRAMPGADLRPLHVMTRFTVRGASTPLYYCALVPSEGPLVLRISAAYARGAVESAFDLELRGTGDVAWHVTARDGTVTTYEADAFAATYGARDAEIALLDVEGDVYEWT